jgi:hypothetical protein
MDDLSRILSAIDDLTGDADLTGAASRASWVDIVKQTGLSNEAVQRGLRTMYDAGVVVGSVVTRSDDPETFEMIDLRRRRSGERIHSTGVAYRSPNVTRFGRVALAAGLGLAVLFVILMLMLLRTSAHT